MTESLQTIAQQLLADHKGLLAADESETTAGKRLATIGLENTVENRRQYRNLFFTAPGIEQGISGIILHHETMGQRASDGTPFVQVLQSKGIIPGIKVDGGVEPLEGSPEEKMTIGVKKVVKRMSQRLMPSIPTKKEIPKEGIQGTF